MKKLLFVIESLSLGGAEKSLVTLLNLLDYEKYEVDLQLFSYGGEFEKLLPEEVNLLPTLPFFEYCNIPYKKIGKKIRDVKALDSQLSYSLKLRRKKYNNIEKSVLMWKSVKKSFQVMDKQYDVAIAYAQGVPTFYVVDKVKALKKIAWINVSYFPKGEYKEYISGYFNQYEYINTVSESVYNQFVQEFELQKNKAVLIKDIIDVDFNEKMALMSEAKEFEDSADIYKILTVGRLVNQKGYDIAVEACKILREEGIQFKWYVIGEGNKRQMISEKIKEYGLQENFILLGAKSNPYPYFSKCDIYVQTSRFEGFGITIAEARLFNKPIVTTKFDAVYSQITPDENGLVVDIDAKAVAIGIEKMIRDKEYRKKIIENVTKEKKGNREELGKFYDIIEKCISE